MLPYKMLLIQFKKKSLKKFRKSTKNYKALDPKAPFWLAIGVYIPKNYPKM
jgi:hypothetical protein